jgi:regulatory protein
MKIVDLRVRRKGLTDLITDQGEELLIDTEIVIAKDIKPGVVIDDPDALVYESDFKRAKSRALWYLSRADHSEKKLLQKLIAGGFSSEASRAAVDRMMELDLVNDTRYAQRLFEYMSSSGISKREIVYKLRERGISAHLAKETAENAPNDDKEKIQKLLKTKYSSKLGNEDGVRKTFNTLVRHGFSFSDVKEALREYSIEIENSEEY